jgi:hypothetical protein
MSALEASAQLWGLAPLFVFGVIFIELIRRGRNAVEAFLQSALLWAGLVWIASNLLSFAGALTPAGLRVFWLVAAGAGLIFNRRRGVIPRIVWLRGPDGFERCLLAVAAIVFGLVAIRALVSPPNTVDVLNYHLPRQVRWLQQGALQHYDTINARENIMPPLAELIGAQFLGLTGGDRWANLPQTFSYAGLAIAVAWLARMSGAVGRSAMLAGLLAMLLPMAYHEASGAKNDLMGAFWTVQACVTILWIRNGLPRGGGWLGLAVALAWLTKSTSMIFVPVAVLCGLAGPLLLQRRTSAWRSALAGLAVWLVLVAPFHARNLIGTGTPLGEHKAEDGGGQINEAMSPALFASNALRQASLHLPGPVGGLDAAWLRMVQGYHRAVGIDPSDPRVTLWITEFIPSYDPEVETLAGAPAHLLLIVAALGMVYWRRPDDQARQVRWLGWAVVAGAIVFCCLLKWQPWAARLHLPLFALGLVPLAVVIPRSRHVIDPASCLVLALGLAGWLPAINTEGRELWGNTAIWRCSRQSGYYKKLPQLEQRDEGLAKVMRDSGARNVMIVNLHDIAYPLMRRLADNEPSTRFTGVWTDSDSPQALIILRRGGTMPLYQAPGGGRAWRLVGEGYGEGVYLPVEQVRARGWWDRLPDFAGWRAEHGFTVSEVRTGSGSSLLGRALTKGSGRLGYYSNGAQMRLSLDAAKMGGPSGPVPVYMQIDQEPPARIDVVEGRVTGVVDFPLPSSPGWHHLTLSVPGGSGDIVILGLVINDAPPSN